MEYEPVGDPAGAWMTPLAHRQFFPQEWEALLHYNGFEVVRLDGDFMGGPLTSMSDVMVWQTRLRADRTPTPAIAKCSRRSRRFFRVTRSGIRAI